jgi:two-component system chemotaxis response regulator CheY
MFHKSLNILIADDEPLMRGLLTSYLGKECHHNITKAKDGKEALEIYQLHHRDIDFIFLDIDMPKVDGLTALKQIREINPNAYVVIISGVGTMKNVRTAIAAGVNGFIAKPYTNGKIGETLDNYFKYMAAKKAA